MVPAPRKQFNAKFTNEKYQSFLKEVQAVHPGALEFRLAETAVFVPKDFTKKMLDACEAIVDTITDPNFKELTKNAIPKNLVVPAENDHAHFLVFDFGICINEAGEYEPQLIEMQGFPSLFAWEITLDDVFRKHFVVPANYSAFLGNHDKASYIQHLKEIILGNHSPENVILLEIFPHVQKTRRDFYCTQDYVGIKPVCLTELIREGRKLFYLNEGKKTEIQR